MILAYINTHEIHTHRCAYTHTYRYTFNLAIMKIVFSKKKEKGSQFSRGFLKDAAFKANSLRIMVLNIKR